MPKFDEIDGGWLCEMRRIRIQNTWPKLENMSVINSLDYYILSTFLQKNQQITTLKLISGKNNNNLQVVAAHLPNVRKLTIYYPMENWFIDISKNLHPLIPLCNLTKLNIRNVEYDDVYGVLHCLKQFPKLCELEVSVIDFEVENNIPLFQKLSRLERFRLSGICLMESTVLEFIRFASKLKEIHIHKCNLKITQKILLGIVEVLKSSRSQNDIEPLKLFIDSDAEDDPVDSEAKLPGHCGGDPIDLKAIQEPDIKKYLCFKYCEKCNQCTSYHFF